MIYPIVVYGDPILRKKAELIGPDYPGLADFLENFRETMYSADGVGLAAPQVGHSIRIFFIDASAGADEDPALKDFKKVFINPQILELSGEPWVMEEGCLSLPEIRENITRPNTVRIHYLDENFTEHEETYSGFVGRIIQHEYDHLEGKLFVDYLSPLKRKLLKNRLMNIVKGKVTPKYKIRVPV
jgi:peptide deformylase